MKVLHLLSSNKYSGAENVACQIINMFKGEIDMVYCSPLGPVENNLNDINIQHNLIKKLSYKEVIKVVKDFKPDIIHAHDLRGCAVASKIKGIRKIAHIHVNHPKMKKYCLRSILAKIILSKFDKIIWVSKSCYNDYVFNKSFVNNSIVLPNIMSIDFILDREKAAINKNKFDIVYCGRITEQKNPFRMLDIIEKLKVNKPDVSLGIIGNGNLYDNLKTEIVKRDLSKNIKLLGFIENPYSVVANSKIMILTSLFEGTPMTALESMSLKTPIISTKTDGMKDLISEGENGYLYDTNDEACNIICSLINDKEKLQKLRLSTFEFAKKYNDKTTYKKDIKGIYFLK